MVDVSQLLSSQGPHLHFVECATARALERELHHRGVRVFAGQLAHVTTAARLFDELAEALALPAYFGRNWDALDECLRDLPELSGKQQVTLVLYDSHPAWRESTQLVAQFVECWLTAAAVAEQSDAALHLVFAW